MPIFTAAAAVVTVVALLIPTEDDDSPRYASAASALTALMPIALPTVDIVADILTVAVLLATAVAVVAVERDALLRVRCSRTRGMSSGWMATPHSPQISGSHSREAAKQGHCRV